MEQEHDYLPDPGHLAEQARIVTLLARAWEEYMRARISKRHAVRVLAYIQRAQELVMNEVMTEDKDT